MENNNQDLQTLNEENFMVNQAQLLGAIDKILIKQSIAKRVSDIQPLKGPVGIVSGAQWDKVNSKLSIAKKDIEAVSRKIRTEFTIEALQDMQSIYGENFYDLLAHYLVDEIAYQVDADFLTMVKDRAITKDTLLFAGVDFDSSLWAIGQSIAIKVNKGLCDLPISDNRSPQGWAIVSSNVASLLAGTLNDTNNDNLDDESPSYLGRIAGVDYYIDYTHPNDGLDSVVFGIKGNGYSKGSTIFSPYSMQWIDTINPDNGEQIFFLITRGGMTINPLDEKYYDAGAGVSGFLGKFNVDLSDLQLFN
jgi:hypothetical protein